MLPKFIVKTAQVFTSTTSARKAGVRHYNSPKNPSDTGRASYGALRKQLIVGASIRNWLVVTPPVSTSCSVGVECKTCGYNKTANYHLLLSGKNDYCKTCNKKVHQSTHPLRSTWIGMVQRCNDPKARSYKYHGGKGITVCKEWTARGTGFPAFCKSVGPKPSPEHTIDRINCDLGYTPENVRWADRITQSHNRENNVWVEYMGVKLLAGDWDRIKGFSQGTVARRLAAGFTIAGAIDTQTREYNKKKGIITND